MVSFSSLNPFAEAPKTTTEISSLRIYPIKSCRGIEIKSSLLTKRGLELDRRWMFADATEYKFLTIREISEMTLIDTAFATSSSTETSGGTDEDMLVISIRGTDSRVMVPARPTKDWLDANTTLSPVKIWSSDTDGYVYGDEINKMFSDYFKRPVVLVYKGPTPRMLGGNGAPAHLGRSESTNFPDVLPLQIANEASMSELNQRLKQKGSHEITIERFRPNIIVKGNLGGNAEDPAPTAWSEDDWKTVRIVTDSPEGFFSSNKLDIDVAARCARCQVPNVDPETAVKDKHEPWDTLVGYRRVDEGIKYKPCFGMLSVPRSEGQISVGMKFQVIATTTGHKYVKGF